MKNPDFQELFAKWMKFGAYTPLMCSRETDIPRKIYDLDEKDAMSDDNTGWP